MKNGDVSLCLESSILTTGNARSAGLNQRYGYIVSKQTVSYHVRKAARTLESANQQEEELSQPAPDQQEEEQPSGQ